ncbi:hypothetical protein ABDJ41_03065 [Pedobacter sp. ASV1-7]|uniref:hypothetical protein n=1 Tax=Pedobacter sp. ASV1-7 TaxID=3145237 RepID=UPI0032E89109
MSASTSTTIIIPVHTPALKMPWTSSQLIRVVERKAIIANGKYLFTVIDFSFDV